MIIWFMRVIRVIRVFRVIKVIRIVRVVGAFILIRIIWVFSVILSCLLWQKNFQGNLGFIIFSFLSELLRLLRFSLFFGVIVSIRFYMFSEVIRDIMVNCHLGYQIYSCDNGYSGYYYCTGFSRTCTPTISMISPFSVRLVILNQIYDDRRVLGSIPP